MRLYSITDMTVRLQEALHRNGFATVPIRKGVIEAKQFDASGRVSQTFIIKVQDKPEEPL